MMDAGVFSHFASGFLAVLGAAALRSIVLAGVAGILLTGLRLRNVAVRLAVWKLMLWSALAMPVLALWLPPVQFAVPVAISSRFERFGFGGVAALRTSSQVRVVADGAADANDSLACRASGIRGFCCGPGTCCEASWQCNRGGIREFFECRWFESEICWKRRAATLE